MTARGPYDRRFYEAQQGLSRRSARRIVPLLVDLLHPRHVVDVGCGIGTWLTAFREAGVEDVWGIDGNTAGQMLEIDSARFLVRDLTRLVPLDRTFDLVLSLEVAEHLPERSGAAFVESLTRLGPVVVFSAAIPGQGGTHHVNEQWPDYWATLFGERGYAVVDAIRSRVWEDPEVAWWYAQNTLLYVRQDHLARHPALAEQARATSRRPLRLVHPRKYEELMEWMRRLELARRDFAALVSPGDAFALVDDSQLGPASAPGCRVLPFVERDGEDGGPPPDDRTAIDALHRLRRRGARFVVFAWPAFWWLDHYAELSRYLETHCRRVLANERLVAFELSGIPG